MKNIQISKQLFLELVKYHLGKVPADEVFIEQALKEKLDALASRERYSQAMQAETDEEARELLQVYHDRKRS